MTETSYCRRLIEVDLPIRRISAHSRREKSIRQGHISTLHIWWARRPLAACRSILCAAVWPDPADPLCPPSFTDAARREMHSWATEKLRSVSVESYPRFSAIAKKPELLANPLELRGALLDFVADFANWDNSSTTDFIETAQRITSAAHLSLGGAQDSLPVILDPFAGGGSIPLEALRIGGEAIASDLNPIPVLLNKIVLEYVPAFGARLAPAVREAGEWMRGRAESELARFYPRDASGANPIAYLWARTIRCEGPDCGAEVPLIRSLWLSKKPARSVALSVRGDAKRKKVEIRLIKKTPQGWVDLSDETNCGTTPSFEGTARRGSATCPCCGYTTPAPRVREQLRATHGGANDARLLCVVTTHPSAAGRSYRLPTAADLEHVKAASDELARRTRAGDSHLSLVPDEDLPIMSGVFNAPIYGHSTWGSLYTDRQALALTTLARFAPAAADLAAPDDSRLRDAVLTLIAIAVSRLSDRTSSLCTWRPQADQEKVEHVFTRQALPMTWDFAEGTFLSERTAGWTDAYEPPARLIEELAALHLRPGAAYRSTATNVPVPDDSVDAFVTDPPYYNAVPYADLSDYFYVWLRRILRDVHPDLFGSSLSPKDEEACQMSGWDPVRYPHKDGPWFETQMTAAMAEGRRVLKPDGIGVVVFAHKSTSGWEAQLRAMIEAGWVVTASWPIDTEMGTRLRALNSAVLASSVHLVCRPRELKSGAVDDSSVGDWREVLRELPVRIHQWMPRLAAEGVVGADAIFACLGPALEVFSRYSRVEKASGETVLLQEYLEQVWATVAKEALSLVLDGADASGLEADARLTAIWLWTLSGATASADTEDAVIDSDEDETSRRQQPSTGFTLEFDAARKLAQGLGAHLEQLNNLVDVRGDTARLLPVTERAQYLFAKGDDEAKNTIRKKKKQQSSLFGDIEALDDTGAGSSVGGPKAAGSTLDRIHQSMILFGAGRGEALKRFLVEEGVGNQPQFWKLAQSLSALYPSGTEEKRWVDGVLARKKSFGFA